MTTWYRGFDKQTTLAMHTEVLVLTGSQSKKALREAAEAILREIGPKFRLDERDRPGKSWLTNAETMEYLGLSRPTLARYRVAGTLPYSKVGSSIYYRLADVEAMLESRLQNHGTTAATT